MPEDQTEQLEEIGNHNCFTLKSFGFGGLGVWGVVSTIENGDLPMTNGDLPMKNGDLPMTRV